MISVAVAKFSRWDAQFWMAAFVVNGVKFRPISIGDSIEDSAGKEEVMKYF